MPARSAKPNILLNEQGPYVNSEDNGSLVSRGVDQEPLNHDLPYPPSNLTIDDVSEISKTLTTPPPTPSATMERNLGSTRAHDMFDRIEQQIAELSGELDLFTDIISLAAFTAIESKYTALQEGLAKPKLKTESLDGRKEGLQEGLAKPKLKTESLDGRKAQLIAQLKALDDRIQATRALLPPDVTMACSNIPPSIRYFPENIFLVGIIPGPHEPTEEIVNHYLSQLVEDLTIF